MHLPTVEFNSVCKGYQPAIPDKELRHNGLTFVDITQPVSGRDYGISNYTFVMDLLLKTTLPDYRERCRNISNF